MRRTWIIRTLATTPLASATSRRHRAGANPDVEVVSPSAEVNMQCGQRVNLAVMWIKKKYLYSFNLDSNCNLSPTTGRNIHPGYFFKSQCRYNWNGRFQPFTGHEGPKAPFTRRFVNAIPAADSCNIVDSENVTYVRSSRVSFLRQSSLWFRLVQFVWLVQVSKIMDDGWDWSCCGVAFT